MREWTAEADAECEVGNGMNWYMVIASPSRSREEEGGYSCSISESRTAPIVGEASGLADEEEENDLDVSPPGIPEEFKSNLGAWRSDIAQLASRSFTIGPESVIRATE